MVFCFISVSNLPLRSLPPISVLPGGEFCRCTTRNVIHQKLAGSAREVLTDYATGTKSAQPGLMGVVGDGSHLSQPKLGNRREIQLRIPECPLVTTGSSQLRLRVGKWALFSNPVSCNVFVSCKRSAFPCS